MCRVKNLQQTSQDFDSWFNTLNQQVKVDTESEVTFEQLLAPLPAYDPTPFQPVFAEPIEATVYPSPISIPSPQIETKRKAVEEIDDALLLKRQKQNEAAKRCRQKKLNQLQEAQEQARIFEQESFQLSVKLAVMEKEKQAWLMKEKEMQQQISMLKQQLDESHLILIKIANK
jgi:hypothetical protein